MAPSVACNGAQSCEEILIEAEDYVMCAGSMSCNGSVIGMSHVEVSGFMGANGSSMHVESDIFVDVYCEADLSCSESSLDVTAPVSTLFARGAYALSGASIEAHGDFYIQLSGYYAAYGAKLTCYGNCDILCYSKSACYGFEVLCNGDCVYLSSILPEFPVSDAPFEYIYPLVNDYRNGFKTQCGDDTENVNCCAFEVCRDLNLETNADVVCSGQYSCWSPGIPYGINAVTNTGKMFCEGYYSCSYQLLWGNGGVYCTGDLSCVDASIQSPLIYCTASVSCWGSYIQSNTVYCGSHESCLAASFEPLGDQEIYFLGESAGENAQITCGYGIVCKLYCLTYNACKNIKLDGSGQIDVECQEDACAGIQLFGDGEYHLKCPEGVECLFNPSCGSDADQQLNIGKEAAGTETKDGSLLGYLLVAIGGVLVGAASTLTVAWCRSGRKAKVGKAVGAEMAEVKCTQIDAFGVSTENVDTIQ